MNNPIWDCTNACDVLIDTVNSAEALAGRHIVGQPEYIFRRPNPAFDDIESLFTWYLILFKMTGSTNLWTITRNGTIRQTQLVLIMIQEFPIHSQQSIQVDLQTSLSSWIFGSANVNHKYGAFGADYYIV